MRPIAVALVCLDLALPTSALAERFTGKVVGVTDGDTLTVVQDKTRVTVRLRGVDAPEMSQPYGEKAKQLTTKLVLGKRVTVKVAGRDRARRSVVGSVHFTVREGVDHYDDGSFAFVDVEHSLEEELLKAGLAWWYRPRVPDDRRLAALAAAAAKAKRGLWADERAVPPWVSRNPRDKTDPYLERRLQEGGTDRKAGVFRKD